MQKAALVLVLGLVIILSLTPLVQAESVGCGPEEVRKTSEHITEVTTSIASAIAAGRTDAALALLKEFDIFPQSPDAAVSRQLIAETLRQQHRSEDAVKLLKKNVTDDPYNKITPESLALLVDIMHSDLKDDVQFQKYITFLAVNYYPEVPAAAWARSMCGKNVPDAPKNSKILLDESQKESSIFGRFYMGSTNFCQWDVIRTLGKAGYTVHDNGWIAGSALTCNTMNRYGLVIMNGGPSEEGRTIPNAVVEEIVQYVENGGRLLIVCASKTLGSGHMPQYYNPLMSRFNMRFVEDYTTGGSTVKCKPTSDPAMTGASEFQATFGVSIEGGTVLGQYGSLPIVSMVRQGKGTVVAAGIGTGFQGNTIGDLYRVTDAQKAEAEINRKFLVFLAKYLLSSVK